MYYLRKDDRAVYTSNKSSKLYRRSFPNTENGYKLYTCKSLKYILQERVSLWWYALEWFDVYDTETNQMIDTRLYDEYKPRKYDIAKLRCTLYHDYFLNDVVDEKPAHDDYKVYRCGQRLNVYMYLDYFRDWDSYTDIDELSAMRRQLVLVTNNDTTLLTTDVDAYEDCGVEDAWVIKSWEMLEGQINNENN